MDPQTALMMNEKGGTILCLEVPFSTLIFGIDAQIFELGPKFQGIKMIPPGLHCIYYGGSKESVGGDMVSIFLEIQEGQVLVMKWVPKTEQLEIIYDEEENSRYFEGVKRFDFDPFLGPYPLHQLPLWKSLTLYMDHDLLNKLNPVSLWIHADSIDNRIKERDMKKVDEMIQKDPTPNSSKRRERQKEDADVDMESSSLMETETTSSTTTTTTSQTIEDTQNKIENSPYFTHIPLRDSQQTQQSHSHALLDKTSILYLLEKGAKGQQNCWGAQILGELQYSFICFWLSQSYLGFNQWKRILSVVCQSEQAIYEQSEFYCRFVKVFFEQLRQVPETFFKDLEGESFLGFVLESFFELVDDNRASIRLQSEAMKLRQWLEKKHSLSFRISELDGEDGPIVVEM